MWALLFCIYLAVGSILATLRHLLSTASFPIEHCFLGWDSGLQESEDHSVAKVARDLCRWSGPTVWAGALRAGCPDSSPGGFWRSPWRWLHSFSLLSKLCWCSVTCMLKNLVRTTGILFQAFFSVHYLCTIFQELKEWHVQADPDEHLRSESVHVFQMQTYFLSLFVSHYMSSLLTKSSN